MTVELEALGRRAVACKGWRWLECMHDHDGNIYLGRAAVYHRDVHIWQSRDGDIFVKREAEFGLPNLYDSSTLHGLTKVVEEAWGLSSFRIIIDGYEWSDEKQETTIRVKDDGVEWAATVAAFGETHRFCGAEEADVLVPVLELGGGVNTAKHVAALKKENAALKKEIERRWEIAEIAASNGRAHWAALAMVRETIELLGPVGALPDSEHLLPEPHHEAEALVGGISAMAAELEQSRAEVARLQTLVAALEAAGGEG